MKRIAPVLLSLALILLCLPTLSANQGTYTVGEGGQYPTFEALQTALESTVDLPSAITIELTSDIEGSLILKSNLPSNLTSLTIDGQGYTIITSSPDVSISNNPGSPIQNITVKDLSLRNDDSFYSAQSITLTFEGNCFIQSNFSSVGIARATVVVAKGARLTTVSSSDGFMLQGGTLQVDGSLSVSSRGIGIWNGTNLAIKDDFSIVIGEGAELSVDPAGGQAIAARQGTTVNLTFTGLPTRLSLQGEIENATITAGSGTSDAVAALVAALQADTSGNFSWPNDSQYTPPRISYSWTYPSLGNALPEFWAAPPVEEDAFSAPDASLSEESKTNPSMGGRSDCAAA